MGKETKSTSHHPSGKPPVTSERHDVLYSKARYVLNQRHIKRPWFNLNPFLEKTDETLDLDNYLPEESKYIQRLESLVLCESFSSDLPVDTRELALEKFFEYLYSDEWKCGCSIRVLEGQLLDQLLVSLYRLERENLAVRHTTYAFAQNERKITGCYKLADRGGHGIRDETLMIEFAYFGRLTKDQPNDMTQNPMEYLRVGWEDYTEDDVCMASQAALPSLQEGVSPAYGRRRSRDCDKLQIRSFGRTTTIHPAASIQVDNFRSINLTDPNKPETSKWTRRGSVVSKQLNAIRFVSALTTSQRRQSIATATSSGTPISSLRTFNGPQDRRRESIAYAPDETKGRRRRSSVAATESNFSAGRIRKMSIAHYDNTTDSDSRTQLSDLGDVEEHHSATQIEDKAFYGDEFYLSDSKTNFCKQQQESTSVKLQKKKRELQERRSVAREEKEQRIKTHQPYILPPIPPLNVAEIQDQAAVHHTIKLPDKLPTFEEFIKLLKDDEYYDPRYRNKVRLKSRIIAQRYYIAKGMHRSSIMFNLEHLPEDVKYVGLTRRYMQHRTSIVNTQQLFNRDRRGSNGSGSNRKIRLPSLQEGGGRRTPKKPDGFSNVSIGSNQSRDQRFAEEVHGVTDSEPCKEHCLKGKQSYHKQQREERVDRLKPIAGKNPLKSQTDLAVSGQDVTLTTVAEEGSGQSGSCEDRNSIVPPSSSLRASQGSPLFQKLDLYDDDDVDSPDTETDESDSDDQTPSLFDSSKLNVRYSIERLRKKRRMKRRRPAFLDVLAKYYKMHAALKAFRKGSASREEKSARERVKRMGRNKRAIAKAKSQDHEFVIGKLRAFSFSDAKPKKRLKLNGLSRGDFSQQDLSTFHDHLQKAMDEFVVRREIVVSDTHTFYRAASSVTFTRKSCFHKKHVGV